MSTHHILVDFENAPVKSLEKLGQSDVRVKVFLGKNNTKLSTDLVIAMQALGEKASYVRLTSTGPNALDFHIACYLGRLLAQEPGARCTVISKDKGFDALIAHLAGEGHGVARAASIDAMPELKVTASFKKTRVATAPLAVAPIEPKPLRPRAEPKALSARTLPKGRRSRTSATGVPTVATADPNLDVAIAFLASRRKALPAKMKTLLGSLEARFGKDSPAGEAERVCALLIQRGVVVEVDGKLRFELPTRA